MIGSNNHPRDEGHDHVLEFFGYKKGSAIRWFCMTLVYSATAPAVKDCKIGCLETNRSIE